MQKPRHTFLRRIAEFAPPVFGERVVPMLERRVLPVLSHIPGPAIKLTLVYIVLQVMVSQSTSVQKAWSAAKRLAPHPVHNAVAAVGETSIGGAAWNATLAIRSGAEKVFNPVRDVHEQQRQRGEEAAMGRAKILEAIDGAMSQPPSTTVDDLMKSVEEGTPPASRSR